MSELITVEGTVEACAPKKGNKKFSAIKMSDMWIDCKDDQFASLHKGDHIVAEVSVQQNGQYTNRYLRSFEVKSSRPRENGNSPAYRDKSPEEAQRIVNQSCLKCAVEALGPGATERDYILVAESFADWCMTYQSKPVHEAAQEVFGE